MDSGNGRKLMRIGALARRAGTTMRTIRYYEQLGLIAPAARTKGGFRLYEEEELGKLRIIKHLQLLDLPLAEVKALLDQRKRGKVASDIAPAVRELLQRQLQAMESRMAQYRALRHAFRETIDILHCCSSCPLEPGPEVCPRCPVITSRRQVPLPMQIVMGAAA
jgi:MerR family Zn(II)-responsive transcriptional regulator of zntA